MQWNMADLFEGIADRLSDEVVLVGPAGEVTWRAFDRRADLLAADLLARGLGRGSRVGICAGNVPAYLEAFAACGKVGAVPFNMNYRYRAQELAYLLDNADAEAVVADLEVAPGLAEALTLVERPPHAYLLGTAPAPALAGGASRYEDVVGAAWAGRVAPPGGRSPDDRLFLYTGGTTGQPKAVMWRHGDLVELIAGTATPPGETALTSRDDILGRLERPPRRSLTAAPLIHATGLLSQLANMMSGGCSVFAGPTGFDAAETLRAVERHGVNVLVIVGDVFAQPLLRAIEAAPVPFDLSSLKMVTSAGAMFSQPVKAALLAHLPHVSLFDTYGSTEASGLGVSLSTADDVDGTARFQPGPRARVLADDGTWVVPGSGVPGRVAIDGPMPEGYHKDPDRTAATFRTIDGVRWSIPGDYVVAEADGTLTLLGRGSSCINTGGEKVYPEEVEEALKEHIDVLDACCLGVPDARFGEAVCAIVETVAGREVDGRELTAFVKGRLASYKAPRHTLVVTSLGRLPNGKLDRRVLGELARTQLSAGAGH